MLLSCVCFRPVRIAWSKKINIINPDTDLKNMFVPVLCTLTEINSYMS
jgi:hypothetical protein